MMEDNKLLDDDRKAILSVKKAKSCCFIVSRQ
jgi:hypothetical protein